MKFYHAKNWDQTGGNVAVHDDEAKRTYLLPARLDVVGHSPTGFSWGYGGSGPAQLALAIMIDVTGDVELALRCYQQFKWEVIATMKQDVPFEMSSDLVERWLEEKKLWTKAAAN